MAVPDGRGAPEQTRDLVTLSLRLERGRGLEQLPLPAALLLLAC